MKYKAEPGTVLLVSRKGHILNQEVQGLANIKTGKKITLGTAFRMASVSKQFTAAAILHLASQDKLQLSDLLSAFFPSLPKVLGHISIQQLLAHTSGIKDYEELIPADQKAQLKDKDVFMLVSGVTSTYFQSGKQFRYSNTGYCILSLIVEAVSKLSFAAFIKQYIFDPFNMHSSFVSQENTNLSKRAFGYHLHKGSWQWVDQNLTSATSGDGGIYTSIEDYQKWINALFKDSFISNYKSLLTGKNKVFIKEDVYYNLGWFISKETDGSTCIFHSGESTGFRNLVYYNLDKELLILLFSNRDEDRTISKIFEDVVSEEGIKMNLSTLLVEWLSKIYVEPDR